MIESTGSLSDGTGTAAHRSVVFATASKDGEDLCRHMTRGISLMGKWVVRYYYRALKRS